MTTFRRTCGAALLILGGLLLAGSTPAASAPATQGVTIAAPQQTTAPAPEPRPASVAEAGIRQANAAQPAPKANAPLPTSQRVVTLAPVTALGSQATIDRGKLVTWMTDPVCLIAGHDSKGWSWLDDIPTGRTVRVTAGPCAGTYRVTGHRHQTQKGGPVPGWMSDPGIDLVLQTCTGSSGMGFSLAVRI